MRVTRSTVQKPVDARRLIEQRKVPGMGRGMFAKVNIPRGTRILAEKGILSVREDRPPSILEVLRAFKRLPPSEKTVYMKLHPYTSKTTKRIAARELKQPWSTIPGKYQKVIAIWAANNFDNVYPLGCLINHSCIPSVSFAWNKDIGKQTFHAARDIKAGEELFVQYNNGINQKRSQRRERLKEWGFTCSCPACEDTPEGRQKESKRLELFKLDQKLARLDRAKGDDKEILKLRLKLEENMAKIQAKEGLVHREHAYSYHNAAKHSAKLGNVKKALLYADKALEVERCCIGMDHKDYRQQLDVVLQLRHAAASPKTFDASKIEWYDQDDNSNEYR